MGVRVATSVNPDDGGIGGRKPPDGYRWRTKYPMKMRGVAFHQHLKITFCYLKKRLNYPLLQLG